jgi:tetratricopeptide (TPR) repeat protein
MEYKKISRQELIEKATNIINAPYTATDELFYQSTEWTNTKDEYIKNKPFCELCLNKGNNKKSDDVHHITPLTAGGKPFAEDNLIALCDSCHSGIHSSGGIAVELSIDNLFGLDHINNFTTKLKNVDEKILSQCKDRDNVILIREHRQDNIGYVGVTNKHGEYIGAVNSADASHHYLAFDIDHGSEVSAIIKEVFTEKNKLQCIIEITKSEIDWKEYEKFNIKEKEVSELINKAKQLEKTNYEQAIQTYRKATGMLIEMDRECEQYPTTWRTVRFPIFRISLILEKQKKYKECLEEIESYQKYDDKVWLYAGEKEKIEKRKSKIVNYHRPCRWPYKGRQLLTMSFAVVLP